MLGLSNAAMQYRSSVGKLLKRASNTMQMQVNQQTFSSLFCYRPRFLLSKVTKDNLNLSTLSK